MVFLIPVVATLLALLAFWYMDTQMMSKSPKDSLGSIYMHNQSGELYLLLKDGSLETERKAEITEEDTFTYIGEF